MIWKPKHINKADISLVLLPGLICDARIFDRIVEAVPGAVAIDGYPGIDDLGEMAEYVLDQLPDRFSLLGHSMGGRVAMEVFRRAPEKIERFALVSTGVHNRRPGEQEKRYRLRDIGRQDGMDALVETWLLPMVAEANRSDALMSELRAMCRDAGLNTFENQIEALLNRPEIESLLPTIQCPALVATGEFDVWSPPAQHKDIASHIPGATLVTIPGSGHMLPAERPADLIAAIQKWLNQPITHSNRGSSQNYQKRKVV